MSSLFVTDYGQKISFSENYIKVESKADEITKVPIETVDGISIFSKIQISTQCIEACLIRGIPINFYSKSGKYFGNLISPGHVNTERQRKQSSLYETMFAVELSKKIVLSKVNNQLVVLRRYLRDTFINANEEIFQIKNSLKKIKYCNSIDEIMGYEGISARYYFQGLGKLVDEEFSFEKRTRRPPKDEFNSMLSLGYSILLNEIYGKIQSRGLNPYFGFLHRDRERHPTLSSDMMEEWRAVIVDSLVMSLVNGHEIKKHHFVYNNGAYTLTSDGMKIFINKLQNKLKTKIKYLSYIDYAVDFRRAMDLQVNQLANAIDTENVELYFPVFIR